jgi:PPM family protein phosphatase
LSELEAMRHPRRNEVFRDVGSRLHKPDDADFIEYRQIPFDDDAALILCSDGLSDLLTSNEILQSAIENAGNPHGGVRQLIEKANAAGGKDNVSAIVVEAEGFAAAHAGKGGTKEGQKTFFNERWAFLLYGLIAGLLAASGWLYLRKPEIYEKPGIIQPIPLPKTFRVAPGDRQYPSIGKALDAARAGDRIEIEEGEYEESIQLKEGVDLFARNPGRAVLRLTRVPPGVDAAVSADGVKRVRIEGLAIKAEPAADLQFGIRISNSEVNLSNFEITGATRAGIFIDGNSTGTIAAGYVHDNSGLGILVAGDASPWLVGNVIYANGTFGNHKSPGLQVAGNSSPEVKRNVFSRNGAEAIRIQRQELKDRMKDNLFLGQGRPSGSIVVEKIAR